MSPRIAVLLAATIAHCGFSGGAFAQGAGDDDAPAGEIIVTAERLPGSIETDAPPVGVYDETAINSLGASNLTDILAALGPQTRAGNGRNSGPPAILLNGQRISGFAEIRDLPPEAIRRVEVFPEEVALRYGFPPDQRVMNFILKERFTARTGEIEWATPTAGGRNEYEVQASMVAIRGKGRTSLSANYDDDSALLETARGIQQPGTSGETFRTLLPSNQQLQLSAVHSRKLAEQTGATLNVGYDRVSQDSLLGLIAGSGDPLVRKSDTETLRGGLSIDGPLGRWHWTLTGSIANVRQTSLTDRSAAAQDRATSHSLTGNGIYTLIGSPFRMPAGRATLTAKLGFEQRRFSSASTRGAAGRATLHRGDSNGRLNLELPIASRRENVLGAIGNLSLSGNIGYQHLSDFGALWAWGYGANWSPLRGLTLSANFKAEDSAPSPQQLGDARIVTPNVTVFDFARGETAQVNLITGGNAALRADQRRDWRFGLALSPPGLDDVSLDLSYFRVSSSNPVSSFPSLTTATELAFPGRVTRGVDGRISVVDQSPVNFAATRVNSLRWGISFSHGAGPGGGPGRGSGAGPGGPRPGGGGGGGRGLMGGGDGKRVFVSVYHTVKFRDQVQLATGLPIIDLLRGGTVGNVGGSPRHAVELEGGRFNKGLGFRVTGNWQSATRIDGNPDLNFGSLMTLSLRAFYNFDQNKPLVAHAPFLKGSRLALRLLNVTNAIQSVRDANGAIPFRFQRGYLDPLGRVFEVSFRKQL